MMPVEALPILVEALSKRAPRIRNNRRYSNGNAPLPEMGKNVRESWIAFQKKARTNYGGLLCDAIGGRMVPLGVTAGGSEAMTAAARRIWRDNRLEIVFQDAIWDMLSTGYGYVAADLNEDGNPIITSEKPEQMITLPHPAQPWRARAALKLWRDGKNEFATVWVPGQLQQFVRDAGEQDSPIPTKSAWRIHSEIIEFDGGVPVHVLLNKKAVAEFEPHIDVLDRINLGKLNRLVVTAMQAFKQRAIKGGLPDEDEDGNSIDWASALSPAPGALWDLPEGIDVWESNETDIRPLIEGEKQDVRDFAAVAQASVMTFMPDSANQSAAGATNAAQAEISKATNRIELAKPVFEGVMLDALRMSDSDDGATLEVQFAPPAYISFQEKATAALAAKNSGQSTRWIARNIWGMSPSEIAEAETDLALERLMAFGESDAVAA